MGPSVLFVCTGNVCRSPMAEYLLRSRARGTVEVSSAGLYALVGEPVDGPSAAALAELGVDASAHRARQFAPADAERSDLILTAERDQRDEILRVAPGAFRRVFTMREFARLSPAVSAGPDPAAVIAEVAQRRGRFTAGADDADDIPDPFRGNLLRARATAAQVLFVVGVVRAALGLDVVRAEPRPRPR